MIRRVNVGALMMALVVSLAAGGVLGAQSGTSTTKKPVAAPVAKPGPAPVARPVASPAGAAPVIVVETEKGTFEFTTFPKEAPRSVEHIVALVKKNFYNGQHFHRVPAENFVIQWGDPATKDMRNRGAAGWGSGNSGKPIGVGEISPLRKHKVGSVALASNGDPAAADSQLYVLRNGAKAAPLDGKYTVIGQVISGMNVVQKITQDDMIKRVTVKAGTPAAK